MIRMTGEGITVIIPAYNAEEDIGGCVESILASNFTLVEVIIVDDCSTDQTAACCDALIKKNPERVRMVRLTENGGPARARNRGAEQSRMPYLFFLDSDTRILPESFNAFIAAIKHADAVTGVYHFTPLNLGWASTYKALFNHYYLSRDGIHPIDVFGAAVGGIRTEVFQELGGFYEALTWGMDYECEEFGHRLARKHRNVVVPGVSAYHHFPSFYPMLHGYFNRVALWVELFCRRRQFEIGAQTTGTVGGATLAAVLIFVFLPLAGSSAWFCFPAFLAGGWYLCGYGPFFYYVARHRPGFLPAAVVLNLFSSWAIALGACKGLFQVLFGHSDIKLRT